MQERKAAMAMGVDLLKARLDCAAYPASTAKLIGLATQLHRAGIAVAVPNPRQTQRFPQVLGILAKTGRVNADVLAHFGAMTEL